MRAFLSTLAALALVLLMEGPFMSCGKEPSSPGEPPDTTPDPEPPAPSVLQATCSAGWFPPSRTLRRPSPLGTYKQVELTWTACPDSDFRRYSVLRSVEPGIEPDPSMADLLANISDAEDTVWVDTEMPWGSDYYYVIRTNDWDGLYSFSNEEHVYVPPESFYGGPDSLIAMVSVGGQPGGVCPLSSGDYVYAACYYSGSVYVLETSTNSVCAVVPVPGGPRYTCASGGYVYASAATTDEVAVIRASDNQVVATLGVGDNPAELCATPDGDLVYAACYGSGEVWCIDTGTWTVEDTIPVGNGPWGVCCLPSGDYVYVANRLSGSVSVVRVSDNTVTTTIDTGGDPRALCPLPSGSYVYVVDYISDRVLVVRTQDNTVEQTIDVPGRPMGICTLPSGNFVYITRNNSSEVSIIDIMDNSVVFSMETGIAPVGICSTPDGDRVYICNSSSATVSVYGYSSF